MFGLGQSIIATFGFNLFIISACLLASSQFKFKLEDKSASSISFG